MTAIPRPLNLRLDRHLLPLLLALSTLWMWLSYWHLYRSLDAQGILAESPKWRLFLLSVGAGAVLASLLALLLIANWRRVEVVRSGLRIPIPAALRWLASAPLLLIFPWMLYGPYGQHIQQPVVHLFLLWLFSWLVFALMRPAFSSQPVWQVWISAACALTLAVVFARYIPSLSSLPVATSWSEGGNLYYASLYFSKPLYGVRAGLPIINPGRAILQSVLFAVPGLPAIAHRIWDLFLWFSLPLAVAWAAARRLGILKHRLFLPFVLWSLLFFFQGPMYYHLLIVPLIVLLFFRSDRFWPSLIVVVIASVWGGLTRINWFPMAGLLAVCLLLLENRHCSLNQTVSWSAAWFGAGFAVAFLTSRLYMQLSGNPMGYFENPLTTPLLWYRLLPSETSPTGILALILLIAAPMLILIGRQFALRGEFHWLRRAGVSVILLVLFLGGLLVSVRIGGGNNPHNMDAFMFVMWLTGSFLYFDRVPGDDESPDNSPPAVSGWLAALVLIVPVVFQFWTFSGPWAKTQSIEERQDQIQAFQAQVALDLANGKTVLLAEEPHLIAFDFWDAAPPIPEYEKVWLMEAAITRNRPYLSAFYQAIQRQQFDRIVFEKLNVLYKGRAESFGEENDAWVYWVAEPLLCYYEPVRTYDALGIQYFVPKTPDPDCHLDRRLSRLP